LPVFEEALVEVKRRPLERKRSAARVILLVLAVVGFNAFGNLSLTWGLLHAAQRLGANPLGYLRVMLNPFVAIGIVLLVLWLLMRMALMSWADLSFVLPVTSVGYVLSALLGRVFLHETVSVARWTGTVLIFAGAVLVGLTAKQSAPREAAAR
jgi:uncharacterized membrane protein